MTPTRSPRSPRHRAGHCPTAVPEPVPDARERLVNEGETGPITMVSIPAAMITKLRGIMLDFDPDLYDPARLPSGATESPEQLFESFVGPMLGRHPLFGKAEVRDTGRGLHALLWLDPAVVFENEAEREKWAGLVEVVQRTLPADPHAPGMTALTRPVGSTNSKTGRPVSVLKPGRPVAPAEIVKFYDEVRAKPFAVVAGMLFGGKTAPCPCCRKPGTRLGVSSRTGSCYGG